MVLILGAIALFLYACASPVLAPPNYRGQVSGPREADERFQRGDLQGALELYLDYLAKNPMAPDLPDVKLKVAKVYEALKRPHDAMRYQREVFFNYPSYPKRQEVGLALAGLQRQLGLYQDSLITLEELQGLSMGKEERARVFELLARTHKDLKEPKKALGYALRALAQWRPDERQGIRALVDELGRQCTIQELEQLDEELGKGFGYELSVLLLEKYVLAGEMDRSRRLAQAIWDSNPPKEVAERVKGLIQERVEIPARQERDRKSVV